jgi:hypothetical protein
MLEDLEIERRLASAERCTGESAKWSAFGAEYGARFPCINCPRYGLPYGLVDKGRRRSLHVRCPGCGVAWIVEA